MSGTKVEDESENRTSDDQNDDHHPDDDRRRDEDADRADHVADVEDGSGCTEIWEQLSEQREDDDD